MKPLPTINTELPDRMVELGKELAALAVKYGLSSFHGSFHDGWHYNQDIRRWPHDIQFVWKDGRHGDEVNRMKFISQVSLEYDVRSSIDPEKK